MLALAVIGALARRAGPDARRTLLLATSDPEVADASGGAEDAEAVLMAVPALAGLASLRSSG